jgi:cytochrome P450
MKNPVSLARAQAEIDAAVIDGALSSPIKYSETTTKLPYVCASIKEAMRMHPSVGLSMQRHAPKGGIELAGKFTPEGYLIGMNPAVVHYQKNAFGEDASDFKPERWLVSTEEWRSMERCLLTFGAGTRTCIERKVRIILEINGLARADKIRSHW